MTAKVFSLDTQPGIQRDGTDQVAAAYFGDGASSQGDVSEAFVFAASYQAPVVINAAGAWADVIGKLAGVPPLGDGRGCAGGALCARVDGGGSSSTSVRPGSVSVVTPGPECHASPPPCRSFSSQASSA